MNGLTEESDFGIDYILGGKSLQELECMPHHNAYYAQINGSLLYIPRLTLGLSASSKNLEESYKFIEFLLSDRGQCITGESLGLPVREEALRTSLLDLKEESLSVSPDKGDDKAYILNKLGNKEVDAFIDQINKADIQVNTDTVAMRIVMEYLTKYINEEISKSDAVTSIENRLNLYVSE